MSSSLMSIAGIGLLACAVALGIGIYIVLGPGTERVPKERRRPAVTQRPGPVTQAADVATTVVGRILHRRGTPTAGALERAGVKMRVQDFVFLVIVATLVGAAVGLVLSGPVLALVLALLVPGAAKLLIGMLAGRRRSAFADQLDDSLQLMATSLRAGHSLLQALAAVAREAEEPTSEEFSRVVNETRVGRELSLALEDTAARMESEDFIWVTQAIAINREVGGNLAEVLDGVGQTIRERNQIRRQVKTLAAEGKLSAYILMALPFGISGFLLMSNPEYMGKFTESAAGYAMIGASVVLLILGGLWLRKVVSLTF